MESSEREENNTAISFLSPPFSFLPVSSINQIQLGARSHGAWEIQSAGAGNLQNTIGKEKLGEEGI